MGICCYLENIFSCTVIHAVIEIKNLLKAGFSCLSLSSHSVIALIQLSLESCTIIFSTCFLDCCCRVNQILQDI